MEPVPCSSFVAVTKNRIPRNRSSSKTLTANVGIGLAGSKPLVLRSLAGLASQALEQADNEIRPHRRTEIADAVLTLHAHGRTLTDSCELVSRDLGLGISAGMIRSWCAESDRLGANLARARELCAEALAESTLGIADGLVSVSEEGADSVGRDKLRVDVRRDLAKKLDPARWGDKVQTVGAVASASVTLQVGGDLALLLAQAGARVEQK